MNVRELVMELVKMDMDAPVFIGLKRNGHPPDNAVEAVGVDDFHKGFFIIPECDLEESA